MRRLLGTIISLFLFQLQLWAQDLAQEVTLSYREVPLKHVLQEVSEQYTINFSYGGHLLALQKTISVEVADVPLGQFLSLILNKARLTYKVMGGNVVLRKQVEKIEYKPADTSGLAVLHQRELRPGSERSKLKQQEDLPQIQRTIPGSLLHEYVSEWAIPQRVAMQEKPIPVKKKPSRWMIAPVFSLDVAQPDLKSNYSTDQRIEADLGYSAGSAVYWKTSERLMLEMMFIFRNKSLNLWYGIETVDDPMGLPVKTEVLLSYLEVPLSMQFRLYGYKRLTLQGVSSLFGSYLLEERERTWLDDGRMFPTTAMLIPALSSFKWGVQGGFRFHYALNDKVSFMLTPVYQYTINNTLRGVQQLRMQEFILRGGILFRL
jgi:hypothetical protein